MQKQSAAHFPEGTAQLPEKADDCTGFPVNVHSLEQITPYGIHQGAACIHRFFYIVDANYLFNYDKSIHER